MGPYLYNQYFVAMMNIINKNKLCPPEAGHKHHIIPKCWFKMNNLEIDNTESNLVLLSYEDHVKVHKLAILCAATDSFRSKMGFAVHRLTNGSFRGMKHTKETIEIIKEKRKNQVITEETKKRISESLKGKTKPGHTAWNKGKKFTELSTAYQLYKESGGEMKWQKWLNNRKEM